MRNCLRGYKDFEFDISATKNKIVFKLGLNYINIIYYSIVLKSM